MITKSYAMTCLMLCANGLSMSLRLQKRIWIDLALERVSEVSINPKPLNISVLDGLLVERKYSPEIFLSPAETLLGRTPDRFARPNAQDNGDSRPEPRARHFKKEEQRTKQRSSITLSLETRRLLQRHPAHVGI